MDSGHFRMFFLKKCISFPESDSEVAEELLKPGHLSRLLEEDLSGDVSCLALAEVTGVTGRLLERLRSYRDTCPARHLGVGFSIVRKLEPRPSGWTVCCM